MLGIGGQPKQLGTFGVGYDLHAYDRNDPQEEPHAYQNETVDPQTLWPPGLEFGQHSDAIHAGLEAILERREVAYGVENHADVTVLIEIDEEATQEHERDDEDRHQSHGSFEFGDESSVDQSVAG